MLTNQHSVNFEESTAREKLAIKFSKTIQSITNTFESCVICSQILPEQKERENVMEWWIIYLSLKYLRRGEGLQGKVHGSYSVDVLR